MEEDKRAGRAARNVKKGMDSEATRRNRDDLFTELRKNKREESLAKRRGGFDTTFKSSATPSGPNDIAVYGDFQDQLPGMLNGVLSTDPQQQFESTQAFRKILSIEKNPPIDAVIGTGIVPRFIEFLGYDHHTQLQFEAAWALTNIASGTTENTKEVLDRGAVPLFVRLLSSPADEVREQAIWALGNIAGDSPDFRNIVLMSGAIPAIILQLSQNPKLTMARNATWTLSNLCRGKPPPQFEIVQQALPTLASLLHSTDHEVLADTCWALSYLSDGPNQNIQALIDTGVCQRLVELLLHVMPTVQTPALRTVGNIVTGDDVQTQAMINCSVLPCLFSLLRCPKKSIRKEACWTISNITAGNSHQIQAVIDSGIFTVLIELLSTSEFDIKKEAAWALSNATSGGTPHQIRYLVSQNCLKPLIELLECQDPKIIIVALDGLDNILRVGDETARETGQPNLYCSYIEEIGGGEILERLQDNPSNDIFQKAFKIIETYFNAVNADQNLGQMDQEGNFAFGGVPMAPQGGFNFGNGM